jgi:hexokinase
VEDMSLQQLNDIRQALSQRISEGLSAPGQQVACLPAYLPEPSSKVEGRALVVDAGGTNLRVAAVEMRDGIVRLLAGPLQGVLPDGRERPIGRGEFFGVHAELARQLGVPLDLPLGYCFSYPAEVVASGDARLVRWTKGIQVSGVEGELVGARLREALGAPGAVKVLNDTVAALLGGALLCPERYDGYIGLIVGTGTNMATFLPGSELRKLDGSWNGRMAVNLESGNFHPPHLSVIDDQLDAASDNPGRQRYEKAVSGYYLPQLFAMLCPDLQIPAFSSSQLVVEWAVRGGDERASQVARWLLRRSADLVAAGLAAVGDRLGVARTAIQAEGGLFWKATGYHDRVVETLGKLLAGSRRMDVIHVDDVNLMGAAAAALTAKGA